MGWCPVISLIIPMNQAWSSLRHIRHKPRWWKPRVSKLDKWENSKKWQTNIWSLPESLWSKDLECRSRKSELNCLRSLLPSNFWSSRSITVDTGTFKSLETETTNNNNKKAVINTYLCCVTGQKFEAERIYTEYIKLQYQKIYIYIHKMLL